MGHMNAAIQRTFIGLSVASAIVVLGVAVFGGIGIALVAGALCFAGLLSARWLVLVALELMRRSLARRDG